MEVSGCHAAANLLPEKNHGTHRSTGYMDPRTSLDFFFCASAPSPPSSPSPPSPTVGHCLLINEVYRLHTTTHHSQYDSSGRVISSSQRPLPDNTQHSQQTNTHAPGRIRTHDLNRRAAVFCAATEIGLDVFGDEKISCSDHDSNCRPSSS